MKKLRILLIIVLVSLLSTHNFYGQSKFSIEVNKPFPMGDAKDFYNGIGDLGMRFTLFSITKVDIGLGINAGYLKTKENEFSDQIHTIAGRAKLVGQVKVLKFEPYLGLGYALFTSWQPDIEDSSVSEGGMNINLGVKIFPIPKLYVNVGYDTTSFSEEDTSGNNNFNMLNLGLGIEL